MYTFKKIDAMKGYFRTFGILQTCRMFYAIWRKKGEVAVSIRGIQFPVVCRSWDSDRHALRQVFVEHDSDVHLSTQPSFIIDGGANVGYASVLFANKYPNALIYAVEPEPHNCDLAQANFKHYPNIRLIKGGIWTTNDHLTIENTEMESWAFTVRIANASDRSTFLGVTIATLLEQSGYEEIDLIKLDIEGTETLIFSDVDTSWIDKSKVIVVEVHGDIAYRAVMDAFKDRPFLHTQCGEKLIFTREATTC